jgi:hypothetical protein
MQGGSIKDALKSAALFLACLALPFQGLVTAAERGFTGGFKWIFS